MPMIQNISSIKIKHRFEDFIRRERPIGCTVYRNVKRLKRPPQEKKQMSFLLCHFHLSLCSFCFSLKLSCSLSLPFSMQVRMKPSWTLCLASVKSNCLLCEAWRCLTETMSKYIHISPSLYLSVPVTLSCKVFCLFLLSLHF